MSTDAAIDAALAMLQRAIVKHPLAAQAIYNALVREGRAFGETDEGRALRERLVRSETTARLQTAWQILTFGMLEADATPGSLPSVLVEAFVQAVFRTRFEARLHHAAQAAAARSKPGTGDVGGDPG
jgi:hypothetical protein